MAPPSLGGGIVVSGVCLNLEFGYPNDFKTSACCKRLRTEMPEIETNNTKILEAIQLNAWFGKVHAVRNINLTAVKNTVTALIGPSGCGKSTFIRCLNRLHEETPGAFVQ